MLSSQGVMPSLTLHELEKLQLDEVMCLEGIARWPSPSVSCDKEELSGGWELGMTKFGRNWQGKKNNKIN